MKQIILYLKLDNYSKASLNHFNKYYKKAFQSFLYEHSKDLFNLHDSNKYKPVSFSSLKGVSQNELKTNKLYWVIIRTNDLNISKQLITSLNNLKEAKKIIRIKDFDFKIEKIKPINLPLIKDFDILEVETPIILKIKKNKKQYYLTYNDDEFSTQLSKNMIKKYNSFTKSEIPIEYNLFHNIKIKNIKTISTQYDGKNYMIGSIIQIYLNNLNSIQRKIIQLNYNIGIGEKTSLGFGFVKIKIKFKNDEFLKLLKND